MAAPQSDTQYHKHNIPYTPAVPCPSTALSKHGVGIEPVFLVFFGTAFFLWSPMEDRVFVTHLKKETGAQSSSACGIVALSNLPPHLKLDMLALWSWFLSRFRGRLRE